MPDRYPEVIKRAFDLVQKIANDKAGYGPIEGLPNDYLWGKVIEEHCEYVLAIDCEHEEEAVVEGAQLIWSIIMHMYCNGLLPEEEPHIPDPADYIKLESPWQGSPYYGRNIGRLRASEPQVDPDPSTSDSGALYGTRDALEGEST